MDEKKRQILLAASHLFRNQGLHKTGMRDIAKAAGMHVGNLYYYFENKQELLAFCQEDTLAGLLQLAARVRKQDLRADHQLYLLVEGHVVRLNEGTPGSLAHLEVELIEPPRRHSILAQRDTYEETYHQVIAEGTTHAVFRPTDAKVTTLGILGALNWTVKWFRPEGRKTARQIGGELAELLVRGLLAPGVELEVPPQEGSS